MSHDFPRQVLGFTEPAKKWLYPAGEIGVRVPKGAWPLSGLFRMQSAEDIVTFLMASAARYVAEGGPLDEVTIPYLPYARQDRVAQAGDPNAVDALAEVLSLTGVQVFHTIDVHSPAALDAFRVAGMTLVSHSPVPYIEQYLGRISPVGSFVLVSPDKGAREKTIAYADALNRITSGRITGIVFCEKVRDPDTGALTGFKVIEERGRTTDLPFVIVDDICDGGGTFHGVLSALYTYCADDPPPGVHLWATHGIYSQGTEKLLAAFTSLGCTASYLSPAVAHALTFGTPRHTVVAL